MNTNLSLPQHPTADTTTSYYGSMGLNGKDKNDPAKVAGQFEGLFYQSLFKQMREDEEKDSLFGSSAMSQITEIKDDEMSARLGQMGQLGMADQILDSIGKVPGDNDYYKEITMIGSSPEKKPQQPFPQVGLLKDPKDFIKELLYGK